MRVAGRWRQAFERTELFGPLEEHRFPNHQQLDAQGLADRVGAMSAVAELPADRRGRVLSRARDLAAEGPVTLRYVCQVFICASRTP